MLSSCRSVNEAIFVLEEADSGIENNYYFAWKLNCVSEMISFKCLVKNILKNK